MLVLKQFFRTGDRGIVQYPEDLPDLRRILRRKKVLHYSTLKYAHNRLLKKGLSIPSSRRFSAMPVGAA